jgi:two-component system NtrC family sensor kinase
MKTVIVGGGEGCRRVISLALDSVLEAITLDILGVVDPDPNAQGIVFAESRGVPTFTDIREALKLPDVELVVEMTGHDEVVEEIYKIAPPGIKIIDHVFARLFWDMGRVTRSQKRQLEEITALEKQLEADQHFLQSLVDKIPDMLMVLDKEKNIVRVNSVFSETMQVDPKDIIGLSYFGYFSGTEYEPMARESLGVIDSVLNEKSATPLLWQSAPPHAMIWEVTHTPLSDARGDIENVLITWHLITERVLLQREVESKTYMFKSFIDSASDWIAVKDTDGRYIAVNQITADSYGLDPHEFVGRKPSEILPEDVAREIEAHDANILKSDRQELFDEVVPLGGRDHYFQTLRFPLKNHERETIGICTIKRDVSREKELTSQLVHAEKMAGIGKLAAGVAHEINNPLTGVLAFTEDIINTLPDEHPIQDDLKVVLRETLRCRDIVRNLLDFAKQDEPHFETLSVNTVIDSTLKLIRKLPQFRDIEIEVRADEDIPPVRGDLLQFQQVIFNLLSNAAEAMDRKGRIVISTSAVSTRRKTTCVISVKDHGPGITEEIREDLFRPFFSTKGSSGLGLAVCWGIVERHGGVIEAVNDADGGAIFSVSLPAQQ